ncbi:MAG TPA: C40 family peptidase [Gemmatimonadales bacterium]|nr:C40 family peptidase [Gemmatimonadales bacterium]
MPAIVATASVAPVLKEPNIRSEQITQLVLGRTGRVVEDRGEWHRIHVDLDGYEGWCHAGYSRVLDDEAAAHWIASADGWSEGATVEQGDRMVRVPLGGRVRLGRHGAELPDGTIGRILGGRIVPAATIATEARSTPVDKWLVKFYGGAPYQWGGLTPWGTDCSGLVQVGFAARGIALPRDSFLQAETGTEVDLASARRGDLLFFSENGRSVTHVAVLGPDDRLVHSSLSAGGFIVEAWTAGTRAGFLRDLFVTARRPPAPEGAAR